MKAGIVGALAFVGALVATAAWAGGPKVGQPAPDFQVETFDGRHLKLGDLKGQVVILNFWATWCAPCRRELPLLDQYYRLRSDVGLTILAVTTEDSVPAARLKPLAAAVSFPLVRRIRGPYGAIHRAVPTNYIIDRAGLVRYAEAGAFDLDSLNSLLVPLLNERAPEDVAPTTVASAGAPGQ